jgi:hypothetical protein
MIKIKKYLFNSFLVSAGTQRELAETMMRFQEYYENPFWQGKIFTVKEFSSWYNKKYDSKYYKDWQGFNFPSKILEPFKKGLFNPLTKKEKNFLDFFKEKKGNFYVIGANQEDVLKHELCHALFYTNINYRNSIIKIILNNKKKFNNLEKYLIKLGYCKDVILDEIQAYILDGNYLEQQNIKISKKIKNEIKNLFELHCQLPDILI